MLKKYTFVLFLVCLSGMTSAIPSDFNLPDATGTPSRKQMNKMRGLIDSAERGHASLEEIMAAQKLAMRFSGSTKDKSEQAWLGRLYTVLKKKLLAEQERDAAQRALRDCKDRAEGAEKGLLCYKSATCLLLGCIAVDKIGIPLIKKIKESLKQKEHAPSLFKRLKRWISAKK